MTSKLEHLPGQSALPSKFLEISRETLIRCAELLARGEIDWPDGLSPEHELTLIAEVRRFRRTNLVKFIATQIAADIAREFNDKVREVTA